MSIETAKEICQKFANDHKLVFEDEGEVGFGRECVGFIKGESYIAHNPYNSHDYEPIPEMVCTEAYPPGRVNAYHKHECLAVLGRGDEAIIQLAEWVKHLEQAGKVSVREYATGAQGMQVMFSGVIGYCIFVEAARAPSAPPAKGANE